MSKHDPVVQHFSNIAFANGGQGVDGNRFIPVGERVNNFIDNISQQLGQYFKKPGSGDLTPEQLAVIKSSIKQRVPVPESVVSKEIQSTKEYKDAFRAMIFER